MLFFFAIYDDRLTYFLVLFHYLHFTLFLFKIPILLFFIRILIASVSIANFLIDNLFHFYGWHSGTNTKQLFHIHRYLVTNRIDNVQFLFHKQIVQTKISLDLSFFFFFQICWKVRKSELEIWKSKTPRGKG